MKKFLPKLAAVAAIIGYPVLTVVLEFLGISYGHLFYDYLATYRPTALRFLEGGELYKPITPGSGPYVYPPLVVLLFVPFAVMSPMTGGLFWTSTTLLFLWGSSLYLLDALDVSLSTKRSLIVLAALLGYAPTITMIRFGQITGLIVGFVCLAAGFLVRENNVEVEHRRAPFSGLFTGLSSYVKILFAPTNAHALRNPARLLTVFATGVVILITGVAVFGVDAHITYIQTRLLQPSYIQSGATQPSSWTTSVFAALYALKPLDNAVRVLLIIFVIGVSIYIVGDDGLLVELRVFALGLTVIPIVDPKASFKILMVLIPAYIILYYSERKSATAHTSIIFISIVLIQLHPYTIGFLSDFAPRYISFLSHISFLIPIVQPALWGCVLIFGLSSYRTLQHTNWI